MYKVLKTFTCENGSWTVHEGGSLTAEDLEAIRRADEEELEFAELLSQEETSAIV